jgi:hypothetical protein
MGEAPELAASLRDVGASQSKVEQALAKLRRQRHPAAHPLRVGTNALYVVRSSSKPSL